MAMSEQMRVIKELREGPGATVEERTDGMLSRMGWDKQLDKLDDNFRSIVRLALERLALRRGGGDDGDPRDIEKERRRKEYEKAVASGMYGDLVGDLYVGLTPPELVQHLPLQEYWVESLGRNVPREELASNLRAIAELREVAFALVKKLDAEIQPHKHELAIFEELLRRHGVHRGASADLGDGHRQ